MPHVQPGANLGSAVRNARVTVARHASNQAAIAILRRTARSPMSRTGAATYVAERCLAQVIPGSAACMIVKNILTRSSVRLRRWRRADCEPACDECGGDAGTRP